MAIISSVSRVRGSTQRASEAKLLSVRWVVHAEWARRPRARLRRRVRLPIRPRDVTPFAKMRGPETVKHRRRTTPPALELHLLSSVLGAGAAHTAHGGTTSAANELGVAPGTPGLPRARVRGGSAFTSAAEINIFAARTPVIVEPLQRQLTRPTFPLTPGSQLGERYPPPIAAFVRVASPRHAAPTPAKARRPETRAS